MTAARGFMGRALLLMLVEAMSLPLVAQSPDPDAAIVASAGAAKVTRAELLESVREERTSGNLLRLASASTVEGVEALSRRLLEQKLMAHGARATALDREPTVARLLTRAADRLLADVVIQQELARLDLSEVALRQFYHAHPDRFRSTPRRKASHIVVATRDEARAVVAALAAGAEFAAVARERNTDATRGSGGDLGWVSPGVMVKSFDAALFALDPTRISEPVQTSFGWHVIKIDQVDLGALPPFELIAERVATALKTDAVERLKVKVFEGVTVNIDRQALGALVK
jgi:peptidyl-prolyl cis-trans isomerase C